jgi:hypothetical protein
MDRDTAFIEKKLKELRQERVADEIAERREKVELERFNARFQLFEDELKDRGIGSATDLGRRLIIEWLLSYFAHDGRFDEEAFFGDDL